MPCGRGTSPQPSPRWRLLPEHATGPAWRDGSTRALIAGCLVGFGVSWNITNTGALAETLSRHHDIGLGTVGPLTSAAFFAEIAVMLQGGRAIDPLGRAWDQSRGVGAVRDR